MQKALENQLDPIRVKCWNSYETWKPRL